MPICNCFQYYYIGTFCHGTPSETPSQPRRSGKIKMSTMTEHPPETRPAVGYAVWTPPVPSQACPESPFTARDGQPSQTNGHHKRAFKRAFLPPLQWLPGEPSSPLDMCVLLDSSNNYQAKTVFCTEQHNFVCMSALKPCEANVCQNGGNCTSCFGDSSNFCDCLDGFEGLHCEIDTDECASNPCQHGGTCWDQVNSYSCRCPTGYDGDNCQVEIDWCSMVTCPFGWTCQNLITHFSCLAPTVRKLQPSLHEIRYLSSLKACLKITSRFTCNSPSDPFADSPFYLGGSSDTCRRWDIRAGGYSSPFDAFSGLGDLSLVCMFYVRSGCLAFCVPSPFAEMYRSGICRRHLGNRAGPSRSIYRAVTGGHTVSTPKQARGALLIPFPRYSYKRSRRRHAQAGPCTHERSCRGTPKQARGAVSITFPYSYKRSHRRQAQASAAYKCSSASCPADMYCKEESGASFSCWAN
ncbi:hypothetical protein Bbelb_292700 [Branchiostoma belcheri]|nr:hypothetical protein Bbelb_292700 [Branchiostoma belcheri]